MPDRYRPAERVRHRESIASPRNADAAVPSIYSTSVILIPDHIPMPLK
jgi:hypothetical protein